MHLKLVICKFNSNIKILKDNNNLIYFNLNSEYLNNVFLPELMFASKMHLDIINRTIENFNMFKEKY